MSADPALEKLRADALAPARGRVVEVGFGTGTNLRFYPDAVTSVVAVDPNAGMVARAQKRIAEARMPVEVVEGRGESLPLENQSCDTAVLILTLCSVADPLRVLGEIRRVLRPDGNLIVMEHGLSDDRRIARWQRRLNPVQKIIACGCELTRPIAALVEKAGFLFESQRKFYAPKLPRTHGCVTAGVAKPRHD